MDNEFEIRTKPWSQIDRSLKIKQSVIEKTVRELELTFCPVCSGDLKSKDNFENNLNLGISNSKNIVRYCPGDNYIIQLEAHHDLGGGKGTQLSMTISTNSKYSRTLAKSGDLAKIKNKQVNLVY